MLRKLFGRIKKTSRDSVVVEPAEIPDSPILVTQNEEKVAPNDFDCIAVIGKGSFGKVMQVRKKGTDKIYAMKVLRKEMVIERNQVTHTKAEKSILQKINHPFIVNLVYAFQTEDKLYMVMDFVNGGELFFHLKREGRFSEDRVKLYSAELILAIQHLHSQDIVYRDLKPENILLDRSGHICITDFGLSKEVGEGETNTFCGTPEYLAPEVLQGKPHGMAVDWWSLGTLVYEMLTGLPPYYNQNQNIMYQMILTGELRFPAFIAPDCKDFLERLLVRDPEKRLGYGISGGDDIKAHAWFRGMDWQKVLDKKIEPKFKPKVKSIMDISQFDPEFTSEVAEDSVVEKKLANVLQAEANFDGFTYDAASTNALKTGA